MCHVAESKEADGKLVDRRVVCRGYRENDGGESCGSVRGSLVLMTCGRSRSERQAEERQLHAQERPDSPEYASKHRSPAILPLRPPR